MATAKWLSTPENTQRNVAAARERVLADYVRYCESHCVEATIDGNSVVVVCPWTKRELDGSVTRGNDYVPCATFAQVRRALGY